jgi:hypothetical protein
MSPNDERACEVSWKEGIRRTYAERHADSTSNQMTVSGQSAKLLNEIGKLS